MYKSGHSVVNDHTMTRFIQSNSNISKTIICQLIIASAVGKVTA